MLLDLIHDALNGCEFCCLIPSESKQQGAARGDRSHDVTYENRTADPSRRGGKTVENVANDENWGEG